MGDWRSFRAKLVAESEGGADGGWAARQAAGNQELLRTQVGGSLGRPPG